MAGTKHRKATEADMWHILRHAADRYGVKDRSELAALTLAARVILKIAPRHLDPPKQRPKPYRGKWTWEVCSQLLSEVAEETDRLKKADCPSDLRTVCGLLAKREPWASLCGESNKPGEVLRAKWQRLRAGWKEMQAANEAKDWDKFFKLWESKATRGEWAGVEVYVDDDGNMELVPFKAGYKSPKIPQIEAIRKGAACKR